MDGAGGRGLRSDGGARRGGGGGAVRVRRGSLLAQRILPLGWARPLITHPRTPGNVLRDARRLRETILRERFDILHAHTTHDHALAVLAARGTPARVARTLHHLKYARPGPASRALFPRTSGFAFANRAIADAFGGPGDRPGAGRGRRSATAPGRIAPRRASRFGVPEGLLVAGTVGKMAAGRGHEEAIRAAAGVPPLALAHVGHGERMPHLKELAAGLGASARNFWHGYQEDALAGPLPLLGHLSLHRLRLGPGPPGDPRGDGERPSDRRAGHPRRARPRHGRRGGVDRRGLGGLSRALARLAASEEMRRQMGEKARRRALAFTAEHFAEKAREFYERILSPLPAGEG